MSKDSVKPTAQQIEERVKLTIHEMAKVYLYPHAVESVKREEGSCFSDGYEEMGLVNTAEALFCITLPYFSMKSFAVPFWTGQIIDLDIIRKSVEYLLDGYKEDDPSAHGTFGFGGTPYIDFRYDGEGASRVKVEGIDKNLDFVDAAAFVVSSLADIKAIEFHRSVLVANGEISDSIPSLISQDTINSIDRRIVDGFKVLVGADTGSGNGYSYTSEDIESDKQDFLYFTWSVLETLEALWSYVDSNSGVLPEAMLEKEVFGGLSTRDWFFKVRVDKLGYLTARFLSPNDEPRKYIANTTVDFTKSEFKQDSHLYYNLFALLGLLCTGSQEYELLETAAEFLRAKFSDPMAREVYKNEEKGRFDLGGDVAEKFKVVKKWSERAFSPLLLKAFSMLRSQYRENVASGSIAEECGEMEVRIYETLMTDSCKLLTIGDEKLDNLWDAKRYSIYYTERVIESVCRYYEDLYSQDGLVPEYAQDISKFRAKHDLVDTPAGLTLSGGGIGQVVVNIDSGVIKDSILEEAQKKLSDIVAKEVSVNFDPDGELYQQLVEQVRNEMVREIDSTVKIMVDSKLNTYFNDLAGRFETKKIKTQDQVVANGIAAVVGFALSGFAHEIVADDEAESLSVVSNFAKGVGLALEEALATSIARENGWELDDVRTRNLVERMHSAIKFLVKQCENDTKQIDLLKTLIDAIEGERLVIRDAPTVKPS